MTGRQGLTPPRGGDRADLARAVAPALQAVPGVARLMVGRGVEVATHHAGGKVAGVSLVGDRVLVCLVADRVPVHEVAARAAAAAEAVLARFGDTRVVDVVVDDLDLPEDVSTAGGSS